MQQEQSFRYGGTNVNVAEIQKTKRQDFINRFLPQLVFFRDIPLDNREKELGELWDICNPEKAKQITTGSAELIKKVTNIPKTLKNGNNSPGSNGPLESDATATDSNSGGN